MKWLSKYTSANPIGISLAIAHWVIVFIALNFIQVDHFHNVRPSAEIAFITLFALFAIDILAIIPVAILLSPLYILDLGYFIFVALVSLFTITFQWLFVGKAVHNFFWRHESEIIGLKITDESENQPE